MDTNVLTSALAARGLCAELLEAVIQQHELLIGPPLVAELERVLMTKLGLPKDIVAAFIALLDEQANSHDASVSFDHPQVDDDDKIIVATALSARADIFVTGDKALLRTVSLGGMPILSPREAWRRLAAVP